MKKFLLCFILSLNFVLSGHAQDTIKVQSLTWQDTRRVDTIDFPDNPGDTYRKIWMRYNMRCHDALVGNGSTGCYEWDYSCNTFITDPSRTDSTKATAPDYTISGFGETTFPYSHTPTYIYTQYVQHNTTLTAGPNAGEDFYPPSGPIVQYDPAAKTYRYQVILSQAILMNQGFVNGSDFYAIRLSLVNPGGTVGFFKVRLKNTTSTQVGNAPDETGLQEVYDRNTTFTGGSIVLPFYNAFTYTGGSLLVDISFTTGATSDAPTFEFFESANATLALTSSTDEEEHNLYFGGAGHIDVKPEAFETIQDEITVAFWSYGNTSSLPANTQVFDATDASGNRQANVHLPWSNGEIYWDCGNNGSGFDRISKAASESEYEGQWNHWAFTKNAATGEMKIFLNGHLWHSGTGLTRKINIDAFRFGQSLANNNPYYGSLDEIQIWDKALDEATIQSWMYKKIDASHPEYSHLRCDYRLNEGTGQLITDDSPLHANTTIAAPTWRETRGDQRFHNFSTTKLHPTLVFLKNDFTIHDSEVTVLDSVVSPLHEVIHFGLSGTDLVRLDTAYLYPAGDRPVFDEEGNEIDARYNQEDGTIDIQTLTYYQKQASRFELLSLVTPYGIGLDLGPEGKTFMFDVTDFGPILKGRKRLSVEFGGENQEELDIQFWFIKGTPERDVLDIQQIWPEGRGYYAEIQQNQRFEPRQVKLRSDASYYKVRSAITGHEQNGEFTSRQHYININGGTQEFPFTVWKACSANPIYPQGGTWIFDRAGWCPGMPTDLHEFALDGLVTPGETAEIDYGVNGALLSSANYLVNNQLVSYGAYHFTTDASIEAIVRPNNSNVEFGRLNPSCNTPTIRVKNSGSEFIERIKISYGTSAGNIMTYTWNGSLDLQEMTDIVLPSPPPAFWAAGQTFRASILEVNGSPDGNPENNVAQTTFDPVTVFNYADPVQLRVQTNATAADYTYTIKDGSGAVVLQRGSMAANTVYTDVLSLPDGCYSLDFRDAGKDGLSFWFFPENGTGSLRFERKLQSGGAIPLYSFNPDFGAGVKYDFILGDVVSATHETDQKAQLFSTYPNPVIDKLNIDLIGYEGETLTFKLVDMTGRTMVESTYPCESSKETTQLEMGGYAPGMYLLHVTNGIRSWVREVAIQN